MRVVCAPCVTVVCVCVYVCLCVGEVVCLCVFCVCTCLFVCVWVGRHFFCCVYVFRVCACVCVGVCEYACVCVCVCVHERPVPRACTYLSNAIHSGGNDSTSCKMNTCHGNDLQRGATIALWKCHRLWIDASNDYQYLQCATSFISAPGASWELSREHEKCSVSTRPLSALLWRRRITL